MPNLRWRYALRDLWLHKSRTLLVILSIAIGLFAFGLIAGAANTLRTQLPANYQAVVPAGARLHTTFFDDDEVDAVQRMPAVAAAEGRHSSMVRYQQPSGEWHDLQLFALEDYTNSRIDIVRPYQGAWPPADKTTLIERKSLALIEKSVGDSILVESAVGQQRMLPITGLTHDMNQAPAQITGVPYAYVTRDTLAWLGLSRDFNELHISVAQGRMDKAHITRVAMDAADKLEESGYTVFWTEVPNPGEHFVMDFLPTILLILTGLGVLALILSAFLVINVITAILTQQMRQIGVMKAIGADAGQITGLYLRMVVIFGVVALLVAIPLGALGAALFARFIAGQLNFDLVGLALAPEILVLEIIVGLVAPLLAALGPISHASRITVREAVQEQGLGSQVNDAEPGRLERLQARLPISRPMRLSVRNTFRRRGRLVRTLIPLMLGGGIFMTVLAVRASLFFTLEETLISQGFDIQFQLSRAYRTDQLTPLIAANPEIAHQESWMLSEGVPVHADGSQGDSLLVYAVPADTQLLEPMLVAGRWLAPDDTNAVVVPTGFLFAETGIGVGSEIALDIQDDESTWQVVGIHELFQPPIAPSVLYVNQPYFWQEQGGYGRVNVVRMFTSEHDAATHQRVAAQLESVLKANGIELQSTRTATEDRVIFTERFNIITVILMFMSFLLAMVGSLGLIGTMSINVLERKREIGVMRAIGASTNTVLRIFVAEGVLIGAISWLGALVLAQPMSRIMSRLVGMTFAKLPLSYVFDLRAPFIWFGIVVVVSGLASYWPARTAANLTVRETLSYE